MPRVIQIQLIMSIQAICRGRSRSKPIYRDFCTRLGCGRETQQTRFCLLLFLSFAQSDSVDLYPAIPKIRAAKWMRNKLALVRKLLLLVDRFRNSAAFVARIRDMSSDGYSPAASVSSLSCHFIGKVSLQILSNQANKRVVLYPPSSSYFTVLYRLHVLIDTVRSDTITGF